MSAGHGVNDAYAAILPALLPLLSLRFGLTETLLALLIAVFALSSSFPAPFLGALSDRLGARLMTGLGIALTVAPLSLVGVAPTAVTLFVLVLLGGLGSAALHPAGSTLVRAGGRDDAAFAVGVFSAGGMIGYALGPALILLLVAEFGLEATPWLMIPGLLVAAAVYVMLPVDGRMERDEPGLRMPWPSLFTGPIGALTLAGALAYLPFLAFISALPLWLVHERGVAPDDPLLGATLAVFSLAGAAGGVATGLLSIRIRRDGVVAGTMLLAIVPLAALLHFEVGSVGFWTALALAGALSYAPMPLLVVSAQDLAPRAAAAASGMLVGVSVGLAAALYVGVGWLQGQIGIGPTLMATTLALIPAAGLSYRVLRTRLAPERPTPPEPTTQVACAYIAAGPLGLSTGCRRAGILIPKDPTPQRPQDRIRETPA